MRPDNDLPETVPRSGWRAALNWCGQTRPRAALVVLLLSSGGTCSALGLLRWQHAFARWSFAAVCWAGAVVLLVLALRAKRSE